MTAGNGPGRVGDSETPRRKAQLHQLERRLLEERERVLQTLTAFEDRAKTSGRDADGDLTLYPLHMADEGSDTMDREFEHSLATTASELFAQVEEALSRLYTEPQQFGVCQGCGRTIAFERLDLLPWTRHCADCAAAVERLAETTPRHPPPPAGEQGGV